VSARADAVRAARRTYEVGRRGLDAAELAAELAASGSSWFADLDELAKVDPIEAGRLARAMFGHLSAHRPESPAPLSDGFEPTEAIRDPRV
jgi:hypothetical protein